MSQSKLVERKSWIDCAKLMAIIAVVVDHTNMIFYTNQMIAQGSYYAVSLFILLAGIGTRMSIPSKSGKMESTDIYIYQFKKLLKIYIKYAIATAVILVWYTRFFDLKTYISHLLNFSIQGPYYYLVFYFQLLLAAPILVAWNEYCNHRCLHFLWNGLTVIFLCCFSSFLIRYTYILPVHGGGQYLFGGTYIILYYLGMVLEGYHVFEKSKKQRTGILLVSVALWIIVLLMNSHGIRTIDNILEPYWGYGSNPPGAQLMVFSIITLFLCYSFFSLLVEFHCCEKIVKFFTFLGKYTLYIFMYHLLVRDALLQTALVNVDNIWLLRFVGFISMIVLPAMAVWGAQKIIAVLREKVRLPV